MCLLKVSSEFLAKGFNIRTIVFVMVMCSLVFTYLNIQIFTSPPALKRIRGVVHVHAKGVIHVKTRKPSFRCSSLYSSQNILNFTNSDTAFFTPTFTNNGSKDINPRIVDFIHIQTTKRKDPFVNLHAYNFTRNSNVCKSGRIFLIIVIHSAPANFEKRKMVRSTFGSVQSYRQKEVRKVFMIGAVMNSSVQEEIKEESNRYGDIVQGNFVDSYKTLVQKHVMAMHWYVHNCKSKYILKSDDDTFVNPYRLIDYLIQMEPVGHGILCKIADQWQPLRDPKSKYYTSKRQYPFDTFPDFCLGFAYITTPETWVLLYRASRLSRSMNMDDVFITGVLAVKAGVPKCDFSNILLPCQRNKTIKVEKLSQKPFFFDPQASCGTAPFKHWNDVYQNINSHLMT